MVFKATSCKETGLKCTNLVLTLFRTGRIHLGYNQTFLSLQSYLPMDMIIYQGGLTTMQGELLVAGVTVEVDGVLKRCQNITVVDDGVIRMKEMYDTEGRPTKV